MADFSVDDVLGVLGMGDGVSRETEGMPQETKPRTPLSVDDVSGVLTDMDKERTRQSVFKGVREDPDAFAKDRATADRAGLPVDAVRMDRQNVESSLKVNDVMGVLEKAPVTKAFMNDENNAKIAHDDVESLSTFENLAAGIGEGFFNRVAGGMTRTVGTFADEIGDALERNIPLGVIEYDFTGEGPLLDWRASTEADLEKEDLTGLLESARVFESVSLGYKPMTTLTELKDAPLAQFLPFALEQGIVSLPDMVAVMGNLPAYVAAQIGYIGQTRAANEGKVVATAGDLIKAAPFAIGSAMLERLGTKGILGIDDALKKIGVKGVAKATGKGALIEGVTEFGQEGLEYAGATLGTERGFDISDGLDQALAGMVGGVGFGGIIRAGTASVESFVKSKQAKSRGESLRSSNDAAMKTKLNQRDPARAATHRADVLRKQGIETVSIDAESVNTFFQGYMAEDSGFIEKLGITEQEMSEAVAIGGDIEISVDAFAEHLYGTERFNDIADYVRLGADNMTVAEATEYEETGLKEQIVNLDREIDGMDTAARTEADTIRAEVEQMMSEAGQVGDSARFAGSLIAAEYATTAQRAGVSALELWKQDRVSILGPDGTARPTVDDLTILLDKARTEDAETFMGLSKTPAIDMLIEQGGVDPEGYLASELAAVGVTNKTRPGLFRKGGLGTADNLVQSESPLFADLQLAEDQGGYIPVDEIVEAVRDELAGAPRRTVDETAALEAFGADVANLTAMMDEAGITLDASEAEIRAALDTVTFEQGAVNTKSDAFKNWFKDSKVVDENGAPMVVYHGTLDDVGVFKEGFASSGSSKGRDFYFTSSTLNADTYTTPLGLPTREGKALERKRDQVFFDFDAQGRDKELARLESKLKEARRTFESADGQNIIPVYLSLKNPLILDADGRSFYNINGGNNNKGFMPNQNFDGNKITGEIGPSGESLFVDDPRGKVPNISMNEYVKIAKDGDHDGLIVHNVVDSADSKLIDDGLAGATTYIAFDPTQIKSQFNSGAFDPTDPRILFQTAFHGTPYYFDKFTLDHIGSGEGVQAYGWGLYFTGNKEIADYYRKTLAGTNMGAIMKVLPKYFKPGNIVPGYASMDKVLSYIPGKTPYDFTVEVISVNNDGSKKAREYPRFHSTIPKYENVVSVLGKGYGWLYKVDIPSDSEYLNWDKKLSEQSDSVRKTIQPIIDSLKKDITNKNTTQRTSDAFMVDIESKTGKQFYKMLGTPQIASEKLLNEGIPGITYLDGSSRSAGGGGHNYVVFDDNLINIIAFEQATKDGPRGSITFDTRETIIRIFDAADKSTFLHESGHLFLDHVKRNAAQFGETTPQFKDDWDTVKEWWGNNAEVLRDEAIKYARANKDDAAITAIGKMSEKEVMDYVRSGNLTGGAELYQGATSDADGSPEMYLTRAMHEQWARGVEDYFRTGQAPSVALQDAFNRFRAWLVSIYSSVTRRGALDVQFPQDVKQVLDRLLASDEEISLVEEQYNLKAFFTSAEESGMTKSQWATYQREIARSSEDAKTRQLKKHLNDIERVKRQWWKDESTRIRENTVEPEVHAMPAYQALYAIIKGTQPNGQDIETGFSPNRLDKAATIEILENEESLNRLPSIGVKKLFAVGKEASVHPDLIAPAYGYESGRAMLLDLINTDPMNDVIEAKTDALMKTEYGDIHDNTQAVNEAIDSVHADKRGEVLAMELNQLRESGPKMKTAFVRQWAKDKIGGYKVDSIRPDKFLAAERKHGKEAGKLLRSGDRLGAQRAKFRQIMNFYMAKESYKEREKIDKSRSYLDKFNQPKKKFEKIDADYVDKIKLILEAYELGPRLSARGKTILELRAMNEWIRAKEEDDGAIINIPARILAASEQTHFRDLTLDDYRDLVDSIHNIEAQGRLKKTGISAQEVRDTKDIKTDIVGRMDRLKQTGTARRMAKRNGVGWYDEMLSKIKRADAAMTKIEFLIEYMDGGVNGPAKNAIFQPFVNSEARENEIVMENGDRFAQAFEKIPKEIRSIMNKQTFNAALGREISRSEILHLALNVGSESNLDKVIRGSKLDVIEGSVPFTEKGIFEALKVLSKEEIDFVNTVWDLFETMYPEVEAVYRRENGVDPERVIGKKTDLPNGTLDGGYMPMIYDPKRSSEARDIENKSALEMMQAEITHASVFSGMTKARTGFAAPVLLDITRVAGELQKTAHFITHYEAVRNANKIIGDKDVQGAIVNKIGQEYYDILKSWVGQVATGHRDKLAFDVIGDAVESMRANATVAIMGGIGGSITTVLSQPLGLFTSMDALSRGIDGSYNSAYGPLRIAQGILTMMNHGAVKQAIARSKELQFRVENSDRDIKHVFRGIKGFSGIKAQVQRMMLIAIPYVQLYTVDLPTFIAAYNMGIKANLSEGDAVYFADSTVRKSQGSGSAKDLSAIMAQRGTARALTMFMTFFNTLYNIQRRLGREADLSFKTANKVIAGSLFLFVLPTMMESLFRMQGPSEDDEQGYLEWLAVKSAFFALTSIPLVRDISSSVESGFGYNASPIEGFGKSASHVISAASKIVDQDKELSASDAKAAVSLLGFSTGMVPSTFINRGIGTWEKIDSGEEWNVWEFFVGPKKK